MLRKRSRKRSNSTRKTLPAKLPVSFYDRPTIEVARALLGQRLARSYRGTRTSGIIMETEAYLGPDDAASHARHGPLSKAAPMFGPPGHAYVYFTYGMHYCMNCVTEGEGSGTGVLIRALEPDEGIDVMRKRRGGKISGVGLTNGPGKLCQALRIDTSLNKEPLTGERLWIEKGPPARKILMTARVGIAQGRESHLRFYDANSAAVSSHPKY
jgi:DNA-3-methyladenine glycosylase